jgi:hypothetical protein
MVCSNRYTAGSDGEYLLAHFKVPETILLIRLLPYSPVLNLAEQIWNVLRCDYSQTVFSIPWMPRQSKPKCLWQRDGG